MSVDLNPNQDRQSTAESNGSQEFSDIPIYYTRKFRFAVKSAVIGSIGGLLFGYDLGVIAGALPYLSTEFDLSIQQEELVTSLMYVGCIVGAIVGGQVVDHYGRRKAVFIVSFIFIIGAIVSSTATDLSILYIGRFMIGIGVAISAIVDVTYLTEISPTEYRGAVVSTNEFAITVGFLLAFIIDYIFSGLHSGWRLMLGVFPSLLALVWSYVMYFMPESPKWLILQGQIDESYKVYLLTCNTSSEAKKELEKSRRGIERVKLASNSTIYQFFNVWKLCLFVSVALMIFQNFSGNAGVLVYAPEIFKLCGYGDKSASIATITLGIIKVVTTSITLSLVDRVGRRRLLMVGVVGMMISLAALSVILSNSYISITDDHSSTASSTSNIALLFVCIYVASYGIGYGPVTWLVVSELFSDEIRGRVLGFATIANWVSTLIVVGSFLSSVHQIGLSYTFVVFSCICGFAFVFIAILIPETARKDSSQNAMALNRRLDAFMNCLYDAINGKFSSFSSCFQYSQSTQLPLTSFDDVIDENYESTSTSIHFINEAFEFNESITEKEAYKEKGFNYSTTVIESSELLVSNPILMYPDTIQRQS